VTLFSPQQVLALAPDASAARSSRELANPRKWIAPQQNDQLVWGEHQGSASTPYQTIIELSTPIFHCSCPSRKLPCKHALGLLLLYAEQPSALPLAPPPPWVDEWLAGTRRQPRTSTPPTVTEAPTKRSAAREVRIATGLEELERWLYDLIRNGLAYAQTQPHSFWAVPAARLVDAQAPGVANQLLNLAHLAASVAGWQQRLLEGCARLHLLLEGHKRLADLPAELQADVRTLVGWTRPQEEVLALAGVADCWLVLGQRSQERDNLRVQRTWLWGEGTGRPALILSFAAPGQSLGISLAPGMALEATLAFYPSAWPYRALIQARGHSGSVNSLTGRPTIEAALQEYAQALAALPWLERFPMVLDAVTPVVEDEQSWLVDRSGQALPIDQRFSESWILLAVSGGSPVVLFGEWDGATLWPMSIFCAGRLVPL
jgi:SWIM zinc finger